MIVEQRCTDAEYVAHSLTLSQGRYMWTDFIGAGRDMLNYHTVHTHTHTSVSYYFQSQCDKL